MIINMLYNIRKSLCGWDIRCNFAPRNKYYPPKKNKNYGLELFFRTTDTFFPGCIQFRKAHTQKNRSGLFPNSTNHLQRLQTYFRDDAPYKTDLRQRPTF